MKTRAGSLASIALGLILAASSGFAAPVGVDASKRYFTDTSGQPVFLLGYYHWGDVVDGRYIDHPARYHEMMEKGATNGLNYIRVSLGINRFTTSTNPAVWSGSASTTPFKYVNGKADLDQWDADFWTGVREQVEYAAARSVIVHICLFDGVDIRGGSEAYRWTNSYWNIDNQSRNFFGDLDVNNDGSADQDGDFWRATDFTNNTGVGVYQRKLIDKAVTELAGYDNVFFEIGNETFGVSSVMSKAIVDYVRTKTTRPITTNPYDAETLTSSSNTADGASQHRADTPAQVKTRVAALVGKGWPAWEDPDGPALISGTVHDLRKSAWYSLTGGAAGWGGFSSDFEGTGSGYNTTKSTHYGYLLSFIKNSGLRFWTMTPNHALVGNNTENSCLANPGVEYLAYVLDDTSVTLNLSAASGSLSYRTYDPSTGTLSSVLSVDGGATRTFNRPTGAADWVVFVTSSTTNTAPTITAQPQAWQTKNVGDSVTFSVTANGTPTPTFQWRKGTTNISGATSSSYTINNLQLSDAGTYSVVVSNSVNSVTSTDAVLTVNSPPPAATALAT
jgi:hypothetical protein